MRSSRPCPRRVGGFALIVTISMMVVLALLVVGLLGLSVISLRSSSQGTSMAEAQANARLALNLAISELQSELGPDRRINCQADIDKEALPKQRNWLAVYDAWSATEQDRPTASDRFRRYLVSGDRKTLQSRDAAKAALPGESINMVAEGTLGKQAGDGTVSAGLVPLVKSGTNLSGQYAWWIGDNNSKAMINAGRDAPTEVSDELLAQHAAQSAPGTGYQLVEALASIDGDGRASWEMGDELRSKSLTFESLDLLPGANADIEESFHDITTSSTGLLTDVRNGGLKRDLSLYLEQDLTSNFRKRLRQPLYTVRRGAEVNFSPDSAESSRWDKLDEFSGITMEELWLYYNLYKEVSYNRPASGDFKVGRIPGGYPTLISASSRDGVIRDPFYVYKRRVYSQVKYILSLAATPSSTQRGKFDLQVSVDPVVVLWNPNNVALEYQTGGFTTVGFSALPYECKFEVMSSSGTKTTTVPFGDFFGGVNGIMAQIGKTHKIVLRPGESRVFSPASDKSGGKSVTVDLESGWEFTTGAIFSSNNFPKALASDDRVKVTLEPKIQDASSDYITYWFGPRMPNPALQSGTISLQHDMDIGDELVTVTTPQAYSVNNIVTEQKIPMMLFTYYLRPERDTALPSKSWIWNNPAIIYRWPPDNSIGSLLHRQFEMKVLSLDTWENPYVQITPDNQAYWGGGVRADFGVPFFTMRSVPLTPPQSLAALQHSCANGFRRHWKDSPISTGGLGTFPSNAYSLDGFLYLAPMASKVIGNSFSQPLIAADRTEGQLYAHLDERNGGTARNFSIADHSYLANAALWDSWYFSSLTPQTVEPYGSNRRTLQQVFDEFFPESADSKSVPLPSLRMRPYLAGDKTEREALIRNGKPTDDAYRKLAAHLMVDGAFNVNSTSENAWKVILGSLRGHDVARRDRTDSNLSLESVSSGETPVNGLLVANGPQAKPSGDPQEPDQWTGFRVLSDDDIEKLATSLVDEIRLRGPFLSLSDFVNRRPGRDTDLAREGALQAAIDDAGINGNLEDASRALGSIADAPFPGAGKGSRAAGIPGFITQADLLTPLGPTLQARSDSFTIRTYGSATDQSGKVLARAWCEATVQRLPNYLDPSDDPDVAFLDLASTVNRNFGRQFRITGFRWLNSEEI